MNFLWVEAEEKVRELKRAERILSSVAGFENGRDCKSKNVSGSLKLRVILS
jgi:hypothetical protein